MEFWEPWLWCPCIGGVLIGAFGIANGECPAIGSGIMGESTSEERSLTCVSRMFCMLTQTFPGSREAESQKGQVDCVRASKEKSMKLVWRCWYSSW